RVDRDTVRRDRLGGDGRATAPRLPRDPRARERGARAVGSDANDLVHAAECSIDGPGAVDGDAVRPAGSGGEGLGNPIARARDVPLASGVSDVERPVRADGDSVRSADGPDVDGV